MIAPDDLTVFLQYITCFLLYIDDRIKQNSSYTRCICMKKALFFVLFFVTLLSVFGCASAEMGILFSADETYRSEKPYTAAPLTFEATIRFPSGTKGRGGMIFSNYGETDPEVTLEIYTLGHPKLSWTGSNGKQFSVTFKNVDVRTNKWTHLAFVRDIEAGKALCYVNGELAQELPMTDVSAAIPTAPMCLGGDMRANNSVYFKGELRNAAVFSDVRTADEIKADAAAYPLDDESLLVCYDAAAYDYDEWIFRDLSSHQHDAAAIVRNPNSMWLKEKDPVTDYAYSFAVIGDTQMITYHTPDRLPVLYQWIVDHKEEKKIEFVMGLGDITEKSSLSEFIVAQDSIRLLDNVVPYSVIRGNHDGVASFKKYFPISHYENIIYDAYDYSMLNTCYELIIGDIQYLIMCLDFGPNEAVLNWAGKVIAAHPNHNVIITTHAYLNLDGALLVPPDVSAPSLLHKGSSDGDIIWEKLVSKYENIVLVLCGHIAHPDLVLNTRIGDHGNTVTEMLVNFQFMDRDFGPSGMICMLYFSEDGSHVQVEYYSSVRNKYYGPQNQFSFDLPVIRAQ